MAAIRKLSVLFTQSSKDNKLGLHLASQFPDSFSFHFLCFSTTPGQAKLGNSWVSPNVGHLILKYLCPALHEVLQDGLKAYVLDLIIGQRRCQPWSLVEASTQLGENTGVYFPSFVSNWYDSDV